MNFYAGIGSRSTPPIVLRQMTYIAEALEQEGWILRSGGAQGADSAFEAGVKDPNRKRIFLPWKGFNNHPDGIVCGDDPELREIAARYHPNWPACGRGARALHTRNVAQVLDWKDEPASKMVICWTPYGEGGGGTGQAIRIAKDYNIPVWDLGKLDELKKLYMHLGW